MITVETLIAETAMFQSLSAAAKDRFRARLAHRLSAAFRHAGDAARPLDSHFLARFQVTPQNARQVTGIISRTVSFSWLALIFGPYWAAHKRVPLFVALFYLNLMAALATLLISWDAYTAFGGLVKTVPVMLAVILAMLGCGIGMSRESRTILTDRFGMRLITAPDRWMARLLGSDCPWGRATVMTLVWLAISVAMVVTGGSFYGDAFFDFNPYSL